MTISFLPASAHKEADDVTLQTAGFARTGVAIRVLDSDGVELPQAQPA